MSLRFDCANDRRRAAVQVPRGNVLVLMGIGVCLSLSACSSDTKNGSAQQSATNPTAGGKQVG
jgi:hypothetical protein